MASNLNDFEKITKGKSYHEIYVNYVMDVIDKIHEVMSKKNISQKKLAEMLGKSEPEVSRLINGVNNYTLKTLAKIQFALEEELLSINLDSDVNTETIEFNTATPLTLLNYKRKVTPIKHKPAGKVISILNITMSEPLIEDYG